jgi:hypothetical protein
MWNSKELQRFINALPDLLASRNRNLTGRDSNDPINSYFNRHHSRAIALYVVKLIPFRDLNLKGLSASRVWAGSGEAHLYIILVFQGCVASRMMILLTLGFSINAVISMRLQTLVGLAPPVHAFTVPEASGSGVNA